MTDHVARVVQRDVGRRQAERQARQAADPEHRQERQCKEHRRGDRIDPPYKDRSSDVTTITDGIMMVPCIAPSWL